MAATAPRRAANDVRGGRSAAEPGAVKRTLLAGGNPQIAKGYGDAPVQARIAAMPASSRDVGHRLPVNCRTNTHRCSLLLPAARGLLPASAGGHAGRPAGLLPRSRAGG
jgi:hypothetical protein